MKKIKAVDYLQQLLSSPQRFMETVTRAKEHILRERITFDAIACRGTSGLLIASTLAAQMEKYLLVVRKHTEGCHSSNMVEGLDEPCRYLIVDDLIASGNTVKQIQYEIWQRHPLSHCVGTYLYYYTEFTASNRQFRPTPDQIKKRYADRDSDTEHEAWLREFKATEPGQTIEEQIAAACEQSIKNVLGKKEDDLIEF